MERAIIQPPIRLNESIRLLIRVLAYATPLILPAVASGGRETLEGWVFLTGFFSSYLVLLLCQPREFEQHVLAILLWFWLAVALLPVLMMD